MNMFLNSKVKYCYFAEVRSYSETEYSVLNLNEMVNVSILTDNGFKF